MSSAAEPSGTLTALAIPPSKASGATTEITSLPARWGAKSVTVASSPSKGTETTAHSASRAASAFSAPVMDMPSLSSATLLAASAARAASREPRMTWWPAMAQRRPRPRPSGPEPPMMAMVVMAATG